MKALLTVLGSFFVLLGLLGIVVPLLPTTPFLLLAAACYAKSSEKFYQWLLNNRLLGEYIRSFRSKNGIPLRIKVKAIVVLWLSMGISICFLYEKVFALVILAVCGVGITLYLLSFPTEKLPQESVEEKEGS